ncbi:MAG: hypothetical protein JW751_10895 [Polyangiaceae bacterium]|nr:hypothetical protein [Polyangiaceae bacterium]
MDQDLLYSLGAFMTVCRIERNDAEGRVRRMIGKPLPPKPGTGPDPKPTSDPEPVEAEGFPDLEQLARDQLSVFIIQKSKGHGMARLVDAVLKVEGYLKVLKLIGPDRWTLPIQAERPQGPTTFMVPHERLIMFVSPTGATRARWRGRKPSRD